MRTRSDKRPNRKYDRKVLVAEESTKSWADSDSDSSSSSSSSSNSEQEEVHCLKADQTSDDELNQVLFNLVQLGEADSLKIELSKLKAENELLRSKSCELKSEIEKLNSIRSSWTQSSISLDKLCEIQNPTNDRTVLGFNTGERSFGETCTQSNLAHDKFKKMSFVKASVIHDPCESVRYDDQISELLIKKGKAGIGYDRPESSKSGLLKNRLDKEKAKAGSKSFVQNQQRRGSKKVKSEWKKVRLRRDLNGGTQRLSAEASILRWIGS
ncbi:SCAR-like protein 1-like [Dorcoceras hygrometricum]|uniref:SCAR-like protein 1-like n=1 Tax=Dorcoceras hygrometricum TaxID=472368 RepID=A0A2Z7CEJ6_9LAMI|nr:SCAR-like protein 1-like [Dorcoceras hygrometricum]